MQSDLLSLTDNAYKTHTEELKNKNGGWSGAKNKEASESFSFCKIKEGKWCACMTMNTDL